MLRYPKELLSLIAYLKRLPGVGKKSAERFAFEFLNWGSEELRNLAKLFGQFKECIQTCEKCGCLMDRGHCPFCTAPDRNHHIMCVTENPRDVYAIEETNVFQGVYHVLGSLLSPIDGRPPEVLNLPLLKERITHLKIQELILAFDSTIEGDATALFIREQLPHIYISRLALGLPLGSSLDFVDEGTLSRAFSDRKGF